MNIVNNQYKIVKELGGNTVSHFLAEDILNENQHLEMLMFDRSILGGDVYRFLRRFFLHIYAFSGEIFLRNVAFAPVKSIDGVKKDGSFLCYCIEYVDDMIPFREWLPKVKKARELAEVFHALLRGLNYLLLRGLPHSSFRIENLYVIETEDGFRLKHKDLVTSEIEYMQSSEYRGEFAEGFFFGDENRTVDLKELAEMFLSFLEGEQTSEERGFSERLESLSRESEHRNSPGFQRLLSFVRKLYDGAWDARVEYFHRIFADFSEMFSLSKVIEEGNPLSLMAKNPIIVGRDEEIQRSLDIVKEISESDKPGILFVKGEPGTGKTRFLRELDFLFNLENILTIPSFHAGPENADAPLKDFFKAYSDFFASYYSREQRREYMARLDLVKKYFAPGQNQELIHEGVRNLFYVINLISDLMQNRRIVFLVDNFEYVNTTVLDSILFFLTDSALRGKLLFIVGTDSSALINDPKLERFLHMAESICEVRTVDLLPLDMNKTMTMMKSILLTTKNDIALGQQIFMETSGNPRWISKLLREYVFNSYVYINTETGQWDFSEQRLEEKKVATSIESFDFQGVENLSAHEREMLQILSCFRDFASVDRIVNILNIDSSDALSCIHKLMALGIVEMYYEGNVRMAGIPNRSIASLIYGRLSEERQQFYHERILEQLDSSSDADLLEFLTQYRALGRQAEAKRAALKIAGNLRRNNPRSAIMYYKMALDFIPEYRYEEAAQTRFVLSEIFLNFGDFSESLKILEGIEAIYPYLTNARLKEAYIYSRAQLAILTEDKQRLKGCRKLIKALPWDERSNMTPAIQIKIEADLQVLNGKLNRATESYLKLIRKHEYDEEYDMILMDCYRSYAYYSGGRLGTPKHIALLEKVVYYAEKIGDTRTMLAALGNIANRYMMDYYDYATAIELFDRVLLHARQGMHLALELAVLKNEAIAETMLGNYSKALELLSEAFRRAEVAGKKKDKFDVLEVTLWVYYQQGNFKRFDALWAEHRDFLEDISNTDYPLVLEIMVDYSFALGDHEQVLRYLAGMMKWKPRIEKQKMQDWYSVYNVNEMLTNGRYREGDILSYIQHLYEHATNSEDQASYIRLFRGLTELLRKFGYPKLKRALRFVQKLEKYAWTAQNKMYVYYFRALLAEEDDSQALEYLYFAQSHLKKCQKDPLGATIHYETARRLVKYGADNEVLIHLLDGSSNVVRMMQEVPEKYREKYFNQYQFAKLFRAVETYYRTGSFSPFDSEYVPANSEEMEYDLSTLVEDLLNEDNRIVELIITEKLRYRGYSRDLTELLGIFGGDRKKNIDRILEYFATGIFATEAFIFLRNDAGEYQLFSSFYANSSIVNPSVIAKYLVSKTIQIEDQPGFIKEYPYINALASFPLVENKKLRSDRSHGYIVFLSDSNVHLFDRLTSNQYMLGLQLLVSCLGSYELKQLVSIDKLTGTLTRKYLFDLLDAAFKKSKAGEISSIAMFDLDHFKRVNDTYGHQVGDLVLKSVTKLVKDYLPEQCKVGRYGGEEFVILFPGWNAVKALEVGEMLLEKLRELKFAGYSDLHMTMSMGIKEIGVEDDSVEEWIEKADRALYDAKGSGRNQCVVYQKDLAKKVTEEDLLYAVVGNEEWNDSKVIVTLTELILLKRQHRRLAQNLDFILDHIIDLLSVREAGVVLLLSDGRERGFYKTFGREELGTGVHLKREFIDRMRDMEKSIHEVDWEDLPEQERDAFPAWNSQLAVRIVVNGALKGLLYLRSPLRERIFVPKDLKLAETLSDVIGVYLSREDFYEYD